MNLFGISSLLSVIFNLIVSFVLFFRGERKTPKMLFGFVSLNLAFWSMVATIFSAIPESRKELALILWQIGYIAVILLPIINAHFVLEFLGIKRKSAIRIFYLIGLFFILIDLFYPNLFLKDVRFVYGRFYWHDWLANKNPLFLVFYIGLYYVLLGYSFLLLLKRYKYTTGALRNQFKYLILGMAAGWIGGELHFIVVFHIDIYPLTVLAAFLTAVYPFMIAYVIIRYRLLDIRLVFTRAGIVLLLYSTILGLPFYIGYKTQSWTRSTICAIILASIGPTIYRFLQRKAENLLLAQQRRYQELLREAASGMIREHELKRLLKLIVYIVKRIVHIQYAAIFLQDKDNKKFILKAIRCSDQPLIIRELSFEHEFIQYLRNRQELLDRQNRQNRRKFRDHQWRRDRQKPFLYEELPINIKQSLEANLPIDLIIPSFMRGEFLGFMLLGEKLNRHPYTDDDIDVFNTVSEQAALAIENCNVFAEFQERQERISNAEKLASIGGMADGVAHQMKNRLNHFSVASGELQFEIQDFIRDHPQIISTYPELQKTFEYLTHIADSLINNVKKTDGIIHGILQYARIKQKETFFSEFTLRECIESAINLLVVKHEIAEFPLKINIVNDDDMLYGIKAQIMESIYNILDNGYEAIIDKRKYHLSEEEQQNFAPSIRIKLIQNPSHSLIVISDNGMGVKSEDQQRIFAPFFTTKSSYKSDSGIGMYVVKRMIEENHNGKIWFTSEYMKGTTFYIQLPRKTDASSISA